MILDATNEIECIPPEQKKFLSGSCCVFGKLSCHEEMVIDGAEELDKPSTRDFLVDPVLQPTWKMWEKFDKL